MFSTKPSSLRSNSEKCIRVNDYLIAVLESSTQHGVGKSFEDEKISLLAIFEQYSNFPRLKINRILPNDTTHFLESLYSYANGEPINEELAPGVQDSSKHPGLLIYTISTDDSNSKYKVSIF